MKFSGAVGNGPVNTLNFGGDPDHESGSGYGYSDVCTVPVLLSILRFRPHRSTS